MYSLIFDEAQTLVWFIRRFKKVNGREWPTQQNYEKKESISLHISYGEAHRPYVFNIMEQLGAVEFLENDLITHLENCCF